MYRRLLLFLTLIVNLIILCPNVALSQGVTTASLNGTVTDSKGDPLEAATIVALHVPSGTQYGSLSRKDGRYNLPGLRVGGPYLILCTFVGYKDQKLENIYLSLGQNSTQNFKLADESVELSEVEINATKDNILNSSRTGAATNITNIQIQALPTINRAVNEFTRLTPQFSSNSQFNGFAGRNNLNNNFSLDGAVYNNVYGLTELPGGQTNAQPVSLDAIQEIQVQIAPFDVRQGGFTGAGVNAITRSGTNGFGGSAYTFLKNDNLVGKKVRGNEVVQGTFVDNQYGIRLGGPIIKNKLFFFVSGELTRANEPAGSFRAAKNGEAGGNGGISRVSEDTIKAIRNFLISKYNYDPGSYENYNFKTENDKFFARIDWNINNSNKLTLRHNYVNSFRDVPLSNSGSPYGGRQINADRLPFQNANYIINEKVNSTVLELTSQLGTKFANDLILTYTTLRNHRSVPGGQLFPFVEIGNGSGQGLTSFGYEPFSANNKLDQDYIQITDNFNMYLGGHTFTVGTSNEIYFFDNSFQPHLNGNYSYYSFQDFKNAANLAENVTTVPGNSRPTNYLLRYPQVPGTAPSAKFKAYQFSFYVQDEWQIVPKLKVTGGLRFDLPVFPENFKENQAVKDAFGTEYDVNTANLPSPNLLFSPRLGINYDVLGDRTLQIRGGTGVFSGRPLYAWIGSNVNLNGISYYDVNQTTSGGFTNLNGRPNVPFTPAVPQPSLPPSSSRSEINVISKDFRFPRVWRSNLAVDYQLPLGIVATLEGMYSKDLNAPFFRNINLVNPTGVVPGDGRESFPSGNKPGVTPSIPNRTVNNSFTDVILMENTSKGYQYFITAQFQKSFSKGLFASIAYNYGRSKDLTSGASSQPTSAFNANQVVGNPNNPVVATSNYEQRHRLIASTSYRKEYLKYFATTVSFFYQAYSGAPYSYIYAGDINADGIGANDLIYIPASKEDIALLPTDNTDTRTPDEIWNQLDNYIEQDSYLKKNRGKFSDRNGATTPWVFKLDARLMQDFYIDINGKRNTFQLTLDIINLGNLLSSDWGIVKTQNRNNFLSYVNNNGADRTAGTEDDRATFRFPLISGNALTNSFVDNTSLNASRWQMQIGLRYIFN